MSENEIGTMALEFAHPWCLALLALLPAMAWLRGRSGSTAAVRYSSAALLRAVAQCTRNRAGRARVFLELLGLALLILALARPRVEKGETYDESRGIDIVMVLDFSGSMDTPDFTMEGKKVTRLTALRKVINEFVERRPKDRVGIIGFAAKPYLVSPLTLDHAFALETLAEARTSGGTAVGSAMLAAGRMLKESDGASKVQILVSDGLSNTGLPPLDAARAIAREGIRVYPIEILERDESTGDIQKHLMHQIATITRGQFFRAKDLDALRSIYSRIESLEKGFFREKRFRTYHELFPWPALAALMVLVGEMLLRHTLWLRLP